MAKNTCMEFLHFHYTTQNNKNIFKLIVLLQMQIYVKMSRTHCPCMLKTVKAKYCPLRKFFCFPSG